MVDGVEMPVEFRPDRSSPGHPLGRGADARAADDLPARRARWHCRRRARCAGCSPIWRLPRTPLQRSQLCELLWDVPNDPRGELRWCLSKIRGLVDEPGRRRVDTQADTVRLDLTDCFVDAIEIARAAQDIETIGSERLRTLATLFAGDFLEGLEIDRSPAFNGWLTAQRRRFRGCHAALLEHLVKSASGRRGSWLSGEVAGAGSVRPACSRAAAERARPARPDPGGRGASRGDHPAVRSRGPRLRSNSRCMAVSQGASGQSAERPNSRSRC